MPFKFSRGAYVKDLVTGFNGVVTARMDSLTGCNRYCVQPQIDYEGKFRDPVWIDEHSLEVDTTKQQLQLHREADQPPG